MAAIYRELGTSAAEKVVNRALGELALTVAGLTQQVRDRELQDLPRRLRRLQRLSENLGMTSLAHVAADARSLFERGDATAFAAVWARLVRVAQGSLSDDEGALGRTI